KEKAQREVEKREIGLMAVEEAELRVRQDAENMMKAQLEEANQQADKAEDAKNREDEKKDEEVETKATEIGIAQKINSSTFTEINSESTTPSLNSDGLNNNNPTNFLLSESEDTVIPSNPEDDSIIPSDESDINSTPKSNETVADNTAIFNDDVTLTPPMSPSDEIGKTKTEDDDTNEDDDKASLLSKKQGNNKNPFEGVNTGVSQHSREEDISRMEKLKSGNNSKK
ncbi:MAG: hypothetical protein IJ730_04895, partial [Alphaproteobacteria bacterium]|nr:hypothetical protein [Alphaproteobacteria bacterium]